MRAALNISLPPDLKQWVEQEMTSGGYGTASEYVRDLLRRARERQMRRQIDELLVEAVEEGATVVMNNADWTSIRKAARTKAVRTSRKRG